MKRSRAVAKASLTEVVIPPAVPAAPDPERPLLALDFSPERNRSARPRTKDGSIKESIIRWLEEQL